MLQHSMSPSEAQGPMALLGGGGDQLEGKAAGAEETAQEDRGTGPESPITHWAPCTTFPKERCRTWKRR